MNLQNKAKSSFRLAVREGERERDVFMCVSYLQAIKHFAKQKGFIKTQKSNLEQQA